MATLITDFRREIRKEIWASRFARLRGNLRDAASHRAEAGRIQRSVAWLDVAQDQYTIAAKYLLRHVKRYPESTSTDDVLKEAIVCLNEARDIVQERMALDKMFRQDASRVSN